MVKAPSLFHRGKRSLSPEVVGVDTKLQRNVYTPVVAQMRSLALTVTASA